MSSGYPSSPYLVHPFNEPEIKKSIPVEQCQRRAFNKRLSHVRIWVEHAFGMLKGRFPGLKELGGTQDMNGLYNAVEALMVVHNLCIGLNDHPEDIWDYDPTDNTMELGERDGEQEDGDSGIQKYGQPILQRVQLPGRETDAWLKAHGITKRLELLNRLCPIEEF